MSKYFQSTHIISTSNCKFLPKESNFRNELPISFAWTLDYRTFFNSNNSTGVTEVESSPKKIMLANCKNSFPFLIFFGLGGPLYILSGFIISLFKVLKANNTVFIISTYRPYSNHIIAYLIKSVFSRKVKWIADFQNLHIDKNNPRVIWLGLQKMVNKLLLKKADQLITVSEGLVGHLKEYNSNVDVVEFGKEPFIDNNEVQFEKFTICYTGSIYPEQSFDLLFEVLVNCIKEGLINKNKISLLYCGTSKASWNKAIDSFRLNEISECLGVLSLNKTRTIQSKSHINLLLTWSNEKLNGIIPGKFYDYLNSGSEILVCCNGKRDLLWEKRMKDLSQEKSLFYNDLRSRVDLKKRIIDLFNFWKETGERKTTTLNEKLHSYNIDNITEKFVARNDLFQ